MGGGGRSVDVLRQPTEALAVALALQHRAHEQLQRPPRQLRARHLALASGLLVEVEELAQLVLAGGAGLVDLVPEDEHGAVAERLVREQRVQLLLGLRQARVVARVHQEHDGVHGGEVVPPHAPRLLVPAQVERREAHAAYR